MKRGINKFIGGYLLISLFFYVKLDAAETWYCQGEWDKELYSICFYDTSIGWAVGDSGTVLKTVNGGQEWEFKSSDTHLSLFGISCADSLNIWAVGDSGIILKSTNGGESWATKVSSITNTLYGIEFVDTLQGWAVGGSGIILHTMNGGETWELQTSGVEGTFFALSFVDTFNGWVVGDLDRIVLHTTDGGSTWVSQPIDATRLHGVYFINESKGWASGDGIFYTNNGGEDWVKQDERYVGRICFADSSNGWTTMIQGILNTVTGGRIWNLWWGISYTFWDIWCIDKNHVWTCGAKIMVDNKGGIFRRVEWEPQNPDADILLVGRPGMDSPLKYYTATLESLGCMYELYPPSINYSEVDSIVIHYGWETIIWSDTYRPPRRLTNESRLPSFLEEGGDVFLPAQEFFWENGYPQGPGTCTPGELIYDYFGVLRYINDPVENHEFADSIFYGVSGDTISDPFAETPLEIDCGAVDVVNWIDYCWADMIRGAKNIFFTENDSGAGVRYTNGIYKTVFLPWEFAALADTAMEMNTSPEMRILMKRILDWFGTSGVEEEEPLCKRTPLFKAYPNPSMGSIFISYRVLDSNEPVSFKVYNLAGQLIRTILNEHMRSGEYIIKWNGNDKYGRNVPNGVYFLHMRVGSSKGVEKLVVIR